MRIFATAVIVIVNTSPYKVWTENIVPHLMCSICASESMQELLTVVVAFMRHYSTSHERCIEGHQRSVAFCLVLAANAYFVPWSPTITSHMFRKIGTCLILLHMMCSAHKVWIEAINRTKGTLLDAAATFLHATVLFSYSGMHAKGVIL